MPGRAKSDTKKTQRRREETDYWMARAVKLYLAEETRPLAAGERKRGARKICAIIEDEFNEKFKTRIKNKKMKALHLAHNTVLRHANGGIPQSQSNASRSWLTLEEIEIVIRYLLACAARCFPLSHERLKDVVDSICRARLGDEFPAEGVGRNWTQRFVEKYSDRLKMYWGSDRDDKRGRAVNPTTNKMWFDLLEATLAGEKDFEFDLPVLGEARDPGDVEDGGFSDVEEDDNEVDTLEKRDTQDGGQEDEENEDIEAAWEAPVAEIRRAGDDMEMPPLENEHGLEEPDYWRSSDDEEDEEDEEEREDEQEEDEDMPSRSESSSPPPPVPILPENLYGADESGFMGAGNAKRRVIGRAGSKMQPVTSDGSRENHTVILTISADGKCKKPVVIFKGKGFRTDWRQDDPLECSIAYQAKGWTDTEIGLAYIKDFDEQTQETADGKVRVLLLDGHNSHYGLEFLRFAHAHRIHILCYPAHGTHVYQGLDVVVFSPLKVYWTEEKARFRRETNQPLKKNNFLVVYGRAHRRAVTEANIKAAFRKTGVWPFDRTVVTEEMMAPSLETSSRGNLPLPPSTPVRAVATLITKLNRDAKRRRIEMSDAEEPAEKSSLSSYLDETFTDLDQSTSSFFISSSPIRASTQAPGFSSTLISPHKIAKKDYSSLLSTPPSTLLEEQLQYAMRQLLVKYDRKKSDLISLQSSMVLNASYCDVLRRQLEDHESRKGKPKAARLVGDGLPRMLTSRDFISRVIAFHEAAEAKEVAKEARMVTAAERRQVNAEWKELEDVRKAWNEEIRAEVREEVGAWEAEKQRLDGKRPAWKKPTTKGRIIAPVPKPQLIAKDVSKAASDAGSDSSDSDSDAGDD